MKVRTFIQLFGLGIASGLLSYWSAVLFQMAGLFFGAGVIFSIPLIIWSVYHIKRRSWSLVLLPLISTAAYYSAVQITLRSEGFFRNSGPIILMMAGMVGAALLTVGCHFLVKKISFVGFIGMIILGTVLSLSWYLLPDAAGGYEYNSNILPLYVCWQTGMMVGYGYVWDMLQ